MGMLYLLSAGMLELSIPVIYIDERGKIVGSLCNEKQNAARQLSLTREIIAEKILNQQNLLKQYTKSKDADKLVGKIKRLKIQGEKIK